MQNADQTSRLCHRIADEHARSQWLLPEKCCNCMPRVQTPAAPLIPMLEAALLRLTLEDLKWYATVLESKLPARKGELMALLQHALTDPDALRVLWERLTPVQQQVIAEVAHTGAGLYDADLIAAKYPNAPAPKQTYGSSFYVFGTKKQPATPYDLFFATNYDIGRYIPADLAARLRAFVPPPPAVRLASQPEPPVLRKTAKRPGEPPEVRISESERTIFHDLGATLYLVQSGKCTISPATRVPTLNTLRQLRQNVLLGDYFPGAEYERADHAIRPLALIVLVQAAKWALPTAAGNKLELTKAGQALLGAPIGPQQIREIWQRWLKSDLLDELSRVKNIKGQQSKNARLTKPADRRVKLAAALEVCPLERWVTMDELLRYLRATSQLPPIERGARTLAIGASHSSYYDDDSQGYNATKYWDVIIGSYLRAVIWEYIATLGLIEIAYVAADQSPHHFGDLYYLDDDSLSRYDGLLALRLTNLGAYVLGLADSYTPPELLAEAGAPVLAVLPNLDLVIIDASRIAPNERALLERIASAQSQDVYRLDREQLLEATNSGLELEQILQFLAAKSGQAAGAFPQIVRVFFEDIAKRLQALRDAGPMLVFESDDPYLLTELANNPVLRALVRLGTIGQQAVLLVPEQYEAAARRQLKKLGYLPRKA